MYWEDADTGQHGLGGRKVSDLPLYRLPELIQVASGLTVVVTEGEKACDALRGTGQAAVATYGASVCRVTLR